MCVIMDMRDHRLSYSETVRKYNLGPVESGGARAMLQRWERIFLEEGAEGLMKERRGRAGKASGCNKGRPPKLDKKVEEDLIAENQRLRMEIEYIKKLSALVLADEKKNGKSNCRTKAKVSAQRFVKTVRNSEKHVLLLSETEG